MIINLSETNSLVGEWMSEIRDEVTYRRTGCASAGTWNGLGEVTAYEISKTLTYVDKEGTDAAGYRQLRGYRNNSPYWAPFSGPDWLYTQGLVNYFDKADHAYISAYRKHNRDGSFEISLEYVSCPPLDGQVLILSDPYAGNRRLPCENHRPPGRVWENPLIFTLLRPLPAPSASNTCNGMPDAQYQHLGRRH